MRNLKKILALVLALVMSLSLMATAGAGSFSDVDADNQYKTAIDVLDELKVFQGFEDGTFKPTNTLTRAQAAVLVYRIATGDVDNKYLDNYTFMQQSKFTDLEGYNWAKGYINYCQNAGIVVGTDATHFNPGGQVTGYQLLVMLLRTLGYGKAGEFTDPKGWELQTASIAEREGITVNVTGGDFHSPAPRQMVAEILFQGLLTETVQYSALTPGGYTKGETLGLREFGLEGYEAVVVANEFADLNSTQVLAQGKTQVQVEGEDNVRTLNYGTKITDIGERRLIYTQNKARVLYLADEVDGEKLNTVKEYGEGVDIRNASKFQSAAEMAQTGSTEFYVNFEPDGYWTSDYRIEYTITFEDDFDGYANAAAYNSAAGFTTGTSTTWTANTILNRVIPAGQPITLTDYLNMWYIFTQSNGTGDKDEDNTTGTDKFGKVFVMTQTKEDISDKISFKAFEKDYLNPIDNTQNWETSKNGQWVKFIDNNNDGDCEYAFKTNYWLDEVISSYKNKAGDTVMQYVRFDDDDTRYEDKYTVRYMEDDEAIERDVAVGDIVLAALVDNQVLVSKAQSVTTSANSYNYKDDEIKAADGETYGQSGIEWNYTDMQDLIANMAPNTEYEMFLDKFGFVRAYRQPGGTKYALVTELYYTNGQYGNLEQTWPMTAELTMPDADGNPVTKEYPVAAGGAAQFLAKQPWSLVSSRASTGNYYNWLQPAIAHLGVTRDGYKAVNGTPDTFATSDPLYSTYWPNSLQLVRNIQTWGTLNEFNYGAQDYRQVANNTWDQAQAGTSSFTNIAVVTGEDSVTLTGAAKLAFNPDGTIAGDTVSPANPSNYAVDYIQLTTDRPVAKAASYKIDNTVPAYAQAYNHYVNADKNTQFYIVYDKDVKYFTNYENMPALTSDLVGRIHAAYAVARNTNTGTSAKNYWMADVIVYEVEKWDDLSKASVSLAYYTASQQLQTSSSVTINTLNSKTNPAKVDLVPAGLSWGTSNNWWDNWGTNWKGYGFYRLYSETAPAEGETVMSAKKIEAITENFADNGIYAGTVTEEVETAIKGGYIPVNMDTTEKVTVDGDPNVLATHIRLSISDSKVYSITDKSQTNWTSYRYYTEADNLQYNNVHWSEVKAGDKIIWVGEAKDGLAVSASSFIVDLGNPVETPNRPLLNNKELWEATPQWLGGNSDKSNSAPTVVDGSLWGAIMHEQENPVVKKYAISVAGIDGAENPVEDVTFTISGAGITDGKITAEDAKNGFTATITADAPYDITGAVVITNKTKDGAGENAVIVDNQDGTYTFYQITGDIKLSAVVTKVSKTLAVNLTDSGLSNVNLVYGDPAQTVATWDGSAKTMDKGTAYTISFTPAAGVTYAVDGVEKAPETEGDNAGKIVITGTLDDNTTIVITKVVYDLAVTDNASVGSNFTLKYDTTTNASWDGTAEELNKDTAYTISFTPAPGYDYTVDGASVTAEAEGDDAGKIVITGTMDAAKTYVVARTAKQVTITVAGNNVVPQEIKVDAGTQLNQVGTAGVITVTANNPVAKYEMPSTITVEIGGTAVVGSAYTWTKNAGTIDFTGLANTVLLEEDMTITVDATVKTFTVTAITNLTVKDNATSVEYGDTVTVTVEGALLTSGVWYSTDNGTTRTELEIDPLYNTATTGPITDGNVTFYNAAA